MTMEKNKPIKWGNKRMEIRFEFESNKPEFLASHPEKNNIFLLQITLLFFGIVINTKQIN